MRGNIDVKIGFMLAALVAAVMIAPEAAAQQRLMQCDSTGYRYNFCNADTQGRVVLLRELSTGNLCRQGRGWGFDNNGIWVDKGCRGEFSYGVDNGGSWDRPGRLTCESTGYRYRYCNANTQNNVSLIREISTGNLCRQGSGWGFDGGGIWVDRGCRGEFRYGNDGSKRNDAAVAAGIIGAFAIGAAIASSQQQAAPPPPPPKPLPPPPGPVVIPQWAIGSYTAWDSEANDNVLLDIGSNGQVWLRNESGAVLSAGNLRDGLIFWTSGKRSWFAREGPGVMLGDIDTGRHFYFRRNA
jgi:hypothetical protein